MSGYGLLPGSKNTMSDLDWMRGRGLEAAVIKMAENIPVCGICGGYQMMGSIFLIQKEWKMAEP